LVDQVERGNVKAFPLFFFAKAACNTAVIRCDRGRLLGGVNFRGVELADFVADKLVDLGIGEVPQPNKFHVAKCGGRVFRGDLASVIEVLDVDSCPCFESRLFFICHGDSYEEKVLIGGPATTLRLCTREASVQAEIMGASTEAGFIAIA
jgi:hypothetical protein